MLISDVKNGPSETVVAQLVDYPQWHRQRRRYGVWTIPVEDPALLRYFNNAQRQLADLLHPSEQRQPHLTLFVCGFEQPACVAADDFSPVQLSEQVESIKSLSGDSCALPLSAPDSFAGAAFIPVVDSLGRLARWRSVLEVAATEVRQSSYVPHITLGLYKRKAPADEVRRRLGELDAPAISLQVSELRYVTYAACEHFGALETQRVIRLKRA